MKKLAVFDLDGTILNGTSAERQLFIFLRRRRIIKPCHIILFLMESARLIISGKARSLKKNKYYLYGISRTLLIELLPEFCTERLLPILSSEVIQHMQRLKNEGYRIIVISGTPEIILTTLQSHLPFDEYIGSHLEINDDKITGRVENLFPYGEDKAAALYSRYDKDAIDHAVSWSFANKYSDLPILEPFGNPVAVHPDRKLAAYAKHNGWLIIT